MARATAILNQALRLFQGDVELCRKLAAHGLTDSAFGAWLDELCPMPPDSEGPRKINRARERRESIRHRYQHGRLNNLPGMERTAWAALNAVTEEVDHAEPAVVRGKSQEERAESMVRSRLFGSGDELKVKAYQSLAQLVG